MLDQAQLVHVQGDPPGPGMVDPDRRRPEVADGVLRPPLPELRAGLGQPGHDLGEPGVLGALARSGAELAPRQGPPDQPEITALRSRHDIQQLTPLLPGGLR